MPASPVQPQEPTIPVWVGGDVKGTDKGPPQPGVPVAEPFNPVTAESRRKQIGKIYLESNKPRKKGKRPYRVKPQTLKKYGLKIVYAPDGSIQLFDSDTGQLLPEAVHR